MGISPARSAVAALKVWGRRVASVTAQQPVYVQAVHQWVAVFVEARRVVDYPEVVRRWVACLQAGHRWAARLLLRHRHHDQVDVNQQ
jgi:hypothetical protein